MSDGGGGRLSMAIVTICGDHNATDIQRYTMRGEVRIADEIIVATVGSQRIVESLTEEIRRYLKRQHRLPTHGVPRHDRSGWVVIDCGEVIVHLMNDEQREYYQLDELYATTVE